jgi:diaminopimelate epimerase
VAADGVAIVEPKSLRLHIYNADGGRAEISGNGARCAAAWLFSRRGSLKEVALKADSGELLCRRMGGSVSVLLPPPRFGTADIPAVGKEPGIWGKLVILETAPPTSLRIHALSMGNPQCVVWGAAIPEEWELLGARLHELPLFPERTNVVFAKRVTQGIEAKLWERGVGPTDSSGTGAAAAAVVGARLGHTPRRVRVHMAGGSMNVNWRKDEAVELVSRVTLVAQGDWAQRGKV